ncbi:MAG: LysR family transcriptional regulator [Clostridiales bacterium]|nr:LysR family transcriptional regulator [Clostridiales bacterium]
MTDKELLYIKTIVDEGSISKAARKLYVTQPSLSHCVQHAEEVLDTRLFIRSPSGLTLTYAGEKYYRFATQVLHLYNDLRMEISEISQLKKGRITIGTTIFLGTIVLPRILPEFKRQYPNIEVVISEMTSSELDEALNQRKLELAVMHAIPSIPRYEEIHYTPLKRDFFVVTAAPELGLSRFAEPAQGSDLPLIDLRHILSLPFIGLDRGKRISRVVSDIFTRLGATPNTVLTSKSFETARHLCAKGYGVTILPLDYVRFFPEQTALEYYAISPKLLPYWDLCAAVPDEYGNSGLVQALVRIVTQELGGTPMDMDA